jgi:hypothetical protein
MYAPIAFSFFSVVVSQVNAFRDRGGAVLHCRPRAFLTPRPSRPDEERHGQGDFIVSAHNPECRMGAHLLLVLALGIPCLVVGCGEGDSKPAPTTEAQGEKMQKYMSNYGEQIKAANRAKAAAKKTPEASKGP